MAADSALRALIERGQIGPKDLISKNGAAPREFFAFDELVDLWDVDDAFHDLPTRSFSPKTSPKAQASSTQPAAVPSDELLDEALIELEPIPNDVLAPPDQILGGNTKDVVASTRVPRLVARGAERSVIAPLPDQPGTERRPRFLTPTRTTIHPSPMTRSIRSLPSCRHRRIGRLPEQVAQPRSRPRASAAPGMIR
jgi:hypothetical protein